MIEKVRYGTSIVKVGFLLSVRIFCLPVVLGCMVLAVVNLRTQYSLEQMLTFIANDVVSFLYLSWASGISYMLTLTLTVLQLREVLHPRFLANLIRSQEAHKDLLSSLVFDSAFTHFRRIIVSMIVYIVFLVLFAYIPLKILCQLMPRAEVSFWYGIPEIQIPLELMCSHVLFLALLDKHKDIIGFMQHEWFVHITDVFDSQRFMLPVLLESSEHVYRQEIERNIGAARYRPREIRRVEELNGDGVRTKDIIIMRPPVGWETRDTS